MASSTFWCSMRSLAVLLVLLTFPLGCASPAHDVVQQDGVVKFDYDGVIE